MATKITKVCDVTGVELADDVEPIVIRVQNGDQSFARKLDLSDKAKADLLKALKPYADKGSDIGPVIVPAAKSTATDPNTAKIRAWAVTQPDLKVSDKGRIPAAVVEAFYTAHPDETRPTN